MNNDKVQIWYYDIENGNKYTGTGLVPQNHVVKTGETFIQPENGLYWPIYFVADKQRWIGTPKEQWLKEHPQPKPEPDPQQVALAGLLKDVATIKNDKSQDSLNAGLMKQVADLKITNASQAKVNANAMKQVAQLKISNATQKQINANAMKDIALMKIQLAKLTTPTAPSQPTAATQPTAITQPTQPSLSVSASQSASTQASQPVTTIKEEQ